MKVYSDFKGSYIRINNVCWPEGTEFLPVLEEDEIILKRVK